MHQLFVKEESSECRPIGAY